MSFLGTSFFLLTWCSLTYTDELRIERDYPNYPVVTSFPIYWNVPSFMCQKHGIDFSEHTRRFGIIANEKDAFRGSQVNILYDPGAYPAVLKSSKGRVIERNGGIPQLGNITYHLEALTRVINQLTPKHYSGIGIIDFEAWRPIFRQNFGDQTTYTNMSKELVRQKHPQYDEDRVASDAECQFERASKVFLETSLKLARQLRPKAKWGYYGYPYCYNYRKNTGMKPSCSKQVQRENNRIQWLYESSDALYPSLYMGRKPPVDAKGYVTGRMNEAVRVAYKVAPDRVPEVNPYMWYKYFDTLDFLTEDDFYTTMETVRRFKAGGFIIWGSSNDFSSKTKCQTVLRYLEKVIGPVIKRVRANARLQSPADDEQVDQVDFISYNGDRVALESRNNSGFEYQVENEASQSYNAPNSILPEYSESRKKQSGFEHEASRPPEESKKLQNSADVNIRHSVPNTVIYTAFGENGTIRTVYSGPKEEVATTARPIKPLGFHYVTHPPDGSSAKTTTPRQTRSTPNDFQDLPFLKEYVKGFENMLSRIAKRWLQPRQKR